MEMTKIGKNLRGQFRFGTKAETLERLKPLVETAKIPTLFYFNVGQWEVDPAYILSEVQSIFGITNSLIFRSSTKNEDSKQQSYAGAYNSHLNVPPDNNSINSSPIARLILEHSNRTGSRTSQKTGVLFGCVVSILLLR